MAPLLTNFVAMAVLGLAVAAPQVEKRACAKINPTATPVMASGYTANVVINGLKGPRDMLFDTLGNILVIEQNGGGIKQIKLTDNGGLDVCASSSKTLVADATVNLPLLIRKSS